MSDQLWTRYHALVDYRKEQGVVSQDRVDEISLIERTYPEWVGTIWSPRPPTNQSAPPPPPNGHQLISPPPPPPNNAPPPPNGHSNGHAKAAVSKIPEGRVPVEISNNTEQMIDQVLEVLGKRFCVFQNAGKLLELQTDPGKHLKFLVRQVLIPRMIEVDAIRAWAIANRECVFGKIIHLKGGGSKTEDQSPPDRFGSLLIRLPQFPHIPVLSAVTQAPTLRADGVLIHEYGYDESTGIFLANDDLKISIPEYPTLADAQAAYQRITDLVCDFEFTNPAGKDVWLAGLLSVVCRHTFDGPAPLFIFDATRRGLGKSSLADFISVIATGTEPARMFYTNNPEEMDKRISSLGLAGDQLVLIDNIVGKLGSPPLDAALTSTAYRGRILGQSKMTPALSMKIIWFATGNGIIIGADTARRSLIAKLFTDNEHPEDRTGPRPGVLWKHNPILSVAKNRRKEYLSDCLTIVSAFIRAGRPSLHLTPMGSFEAWSATIRNAVIWAGGLDPCCTIQDVRAADFEDLALQTMVKCWPVADGVGVTAAALIDWAVTDIGKLVDPKKRAIFEQTRTAREMWHNSLLEWLPATKGDLPTARELGVALRGIAGAVIEDHKIEAGKHTESGVPWLRVRVGVGVSPQEEEEIRDEKSNLSVVK